MRIMLIDDEEFALDAHEMILSEFDGIEVVGKFTDPLLAVSRLEDLQVEVVMLDIEMRGVDGLEVCEWIMNKNEDIEILFVTAHPQYAVAAFELEASDYLLKPISKVRLKKAIRRTEEKLTLNRLKSELLTQSQPTLSAQMLGGFHLKNNQQEIIKWRTRKVKELFLFLWTHHGKPVHKSIIIDQLWPETTYDKAATILHTTVYHLRKTLKENGYHHSIEYINDQYRLSVKVDSDFAKLENILTDVQTSSKVEQVLCLYQEGLLAEEDYSWIIPYQTETKKSVLHYLERAATKIEDETITERCLKKLMELDSYNETYMIQLLSHYVKHQNRSAAIELFERIEHIFMVELEIPLPVEFKKLYETSLSTIIHDS